MRVGRVLAWRHMLSQRVTPNAEIDTATLTMRYGSDVTPSIMGSLSCKRGLGSGSAAERARVAAASRMASASASVAHTCALAIMLASSSALLA